MAATNAPGMPPPAPTIDSAANCAEPPKTSADAATACSGVNPVSTASTPKDMESTTPTEA